jgi:hypothetical protein
MVYRLATLRQRPVIIVILGEHVEDEIGQLLRGLLVKCLLLIFIISGLNRQK